MYNNINPYRAEVLKHAQKHNLLNQYYPVNTFVH